MVDPSCNNNPADHHLVLRQNAHSPLSQDALNPTEEEEPPDSTTSSSTSTSKSSRSSSFSTAKHLETRKHAQQDGQLDIDINQDGSAAIQPTAPAQVTTGTGRFDLLQPHTLTITQVLTYFTSLNSSASGGAASASPFSHDGAQDAASTTNGLTSAEASARLAEVGPNQVSQATRVSAWSILLRQVANAMTIILLAAMALSFGFRDWVEGAVVSAVIALNVILGFAQEYQAERTMANLRQLSSPTALVLRDGGKELTVPSTELVPGDIILFKMGDVVPADVRLVHVSNLEVDEAALTGESIPVVKHCDAIPDAQARLGPGDQLNMAFASTTVTKGRGRGVVVATGMRTQLGRIAEAMQQQQKSNGAQDGKSSIIRTIKRWWEPTAKLLGLRDGTPLQIRLNKFAYLLLFLAIICAIIVFGVAEFDITDEVVLYAIALGVGVLPESLVAVLTITFSVGAKRMAESNVVVRKLAALESLGGVTDICTDKTGTLTTSKMVASQIAFSMPPLSSSSSPATTEKAEFTSQSYGIERASSAFEPVGRLFEMNSTHAQGRRELQGKIFEQDQPSQLPAHVQALVIAAALCNVAEIKKTSGNGDEGKVDQAKDKQGDEWTATGDPTEIALQVMAMKLGVGKPALLSSSSHTIGERETTAKILPKFDFVQEFPFDSTIKRATFMYRRHASSSTGDDVHGQLALFTKGAVEGVLQRCTRAIIPTIDHASNTAQLQEVDLTDAHREAIIALMEKMASQGLRVLAFGHRVLSNDDSLNMTMEKTGKLDREDAEQAFTFLGLAGLYDPPRPETPGAIADCHRAGISVRMLTGDHVATARAIAREIGILKGTHDESASAVMTAARFDAMSDAEIDALPDLPLVVARCSPQSKVRMIAAGRRRGRHLAMTGDGINDAPALKQAPIGIAMGSGTQIAKDCASLTLVDDRYASIVKGIREGRTVFDNIQRFLIALLVANVGEVILLLVGLAFRDANDDSVFPLSPLAILWINMLTATAPSVGLGLEAGDHNIMRRPPHDLKAGVFSRAVITDILFYGAAMGVTSLMGFIAMLRPNAATTLPTGCNEKYTGECEDIYQARATVFLSLTLQLLFIAWELLSMDRSFFRVQPHKRLWRNQMLLWSVVACLPLIPLCLYVPRLNTTVFRHAPLNGEGWGIGIAMTVAFFLLVELWKLLARRGYWPWLTRVTGGIRRSYVEEDEEDVRDPEKA